MTTRGNIRDAFAGESQANRKYLAFAKRAELEGLTQVARLFRAIAQAETVHAMAHLKVMDGTGSTIENLKQAIDGERFEFEQMYPDYMATTMDDGAKAAMLSFSNAMEVEKVHHKLYREALRQVESGQDLPAEKLYVCSVCGNTVMGQPLEQCPVCGTPKEKFNEIE